MFLPPSVVTLFLISDSLISSTSVEGEDIYIEYVILPLVLFTFLIVPSNSTEKLLNSVINLTLSPILYRGTLGLGLGLDLNLSKKRHNIIY